MINLVSLSFSRKWYKGLVTLDVALAKEWIKMVTLSTVQNRL